jgi:hypothetical protein
VLVACVLGFFAAASTLGCGSAAGCPEGFLFDGTTCTFADAGVMLDAAIPDAFAETDAFLVPIDGPLPDAFQTPDAWAPDAWMPFDACVPAVLHVDADGDGFGDASTAQDSCLGRPGLVEDATDCDDARAQTHPGATETCNGIDDDCDGTADEGLLLTFYLDADGDGHGLASVSMQACSAPSGYVSSSDDCHDGCASCFPGSTEVCDGLDNDCDGSIDDGVLLTFYVDADGDTYGTTVTTQACTMPSGYAARSGDCNDACATCYPGRSEVCDGLDNDCDALIDDGVLTTFYRDADGDLHGLATMSVAACTAPSGYVALGDDCNDACATCYPGRAEVCDGLDNNCNTTVDEGVTTRYYLDCDADGCFLPTYVFRDACAPPAVPAGCSSSGPVWRTTTSACSDCADQDSRAYLGATTYQVTPIVGPRTGSRSAWDFNCDGVETRQHTSIAMCLDATVAGWTSSPPPNCGASGFWDDCLPPNETRVQGCR